MKDIQYDGEVPKKLTREAILKIAISAVTQDYIGSTENIMYDNSEDSQEYKEAQERLNNHEGLVNKIYDELMELEFVSMGFMQNIDTKKYLKFEGKNKILELIEKEVKEEWGY